MWQRKVSGAAQRANWEWQNKKTSFSLCFFYCVTRQHPAGPFPSVLCVLRLAVLNYPFPCCLLNHRIFPAVLWFPSFQQVFYKALSFALISPQRRNAELPPHAKVFCLCGVCPVMCQKSVRERAFWCSTSLQLRSVHTLQAKHWEHWGDWDNVFKAWRLQKPILSLSRCYWTYGTAEGTCTRTINGLQICMSLTQWVGFLWELQMRKGKSGCACKSLMFTTLLWSGIGLMVDEKQPKKQSGCGKVVLTCG